MHCVIISMIIRDYDVERANEKNMAILPDVVRFKTLSKHDDF